MAMELAVVSADVGGQAELLPPDCGCGLLLPAPPPDMSDAWSERTPLPLNM
jgi:hypothetical protein